MYKVIFQLIALVNYPKTHQRPGLYYSGTFRSKNGYLIIARPELASRDILSKAINHDLTKFVVSLE